MIAVEKPVMLVAIDEGKKSLYALEWTLDRFFLPCTPNHPFKIVLIHAKPSPPSIGNGGSDLKKAASQVSQTAIELCNSKSVKDVSVEVVEGDAKSVLCEAVEKHRASVLVVGSRGHGKIKRAVLGSVGDYCVHHAHCAVMIVKKPKIIC
ncbi:hypothetical protein AAC387_Pa09g1430 [Persea americana]